MYTVNPKKIRRNIHYAMAVNKGKPLPKGVVPSSNGRMREGVRDYLGIKDFYSTGGKLLGAIPSARVLNIAASRR